ncbi:MAG: sulfur carrier protein ThiS [Gemmatimonadetes bacterium]|nr:sulfur carrier protein ThiS [Gemmatimonadota bacterium]
MNIKVNGEPVEAEPGASAAAVLGALGIDRRAVVVELNGQIIRGPDIDQSGIAPGDRLEIVHFVGGG